MKAEASPISQSPLFDGMQSTIVHRTNINHIYRGLTLSSTTRLLDLDFNRLLQELNLRPANAETASSSISSSMRHKPASRLLTAAAAASASCCYQRQRLSTTHSVLQPANAFVASPQYHRSIRPTSRNVRSYSTISPDGIDGMPPLTIAGNEKQQKLIPAPIHPPLPASKLRWSLDPNQFTPSFQTTDDLSPLENAFLGQGKLFCALNLVGSDA